MKKVLITGACGKLGPVLVAQFAGEYDLRLSDIAGPEALEGIPVQRADLTDLDAMWSVCAGIDTVVHLAADSRIHAPWESLLPNNIIGVRNVFQAAHEAGCRRVVFASSINVVLGYPLEVSVREDQPVRPANLYGASKAWGEALASVYAKEMGLSVICLRLGWVAPYDHPRLEPGNSFVDALLTHRDLVKLVRAAVEAPEDLRFGVFHGVSDNRWKRLDISKARDVLGYEPEDDGFALAGMEF